MPQATIYTELLIATERGSRNIEAMMDNLSAKEYHQIQHFISESGWSADALKISVAQDINELFKNEKSVALLLDESSEEKKESIRLVLPINIVEIWANWPIVK